jgi:putative oxidoreductase
MRRALNVALWAAQLALAVFFGYAGLLKIAQPISVLAEAFVWPAHVPAPLVRFIGISELSGALSLILPAVTRIRPGLAPLAGTGLAVLMVCAAIFHIARGELASLPTNIALGALAAFVAWGRFTRAPIMPRA